MKHKHTQSRGERHATHEDVHGSSLRGTPWCLGRLPRLRVVASPLQRDTRTRVVTTTTGRATQVRGTAGRRGATVGCTRQRASTRTPATGVRLPLGFAFFICHPPSSSRDASPPSLCAAAGATPRAPSPAAAAPPPRAEGAATAALAPDMAPRMPCTSASCSFFSTVTTGVLTAVLRTFHAKPLPRLWDAIAHAQRQQPAHAHTDMHARTHTHTTRYMSTHVRDNGAAGAVAAGAVAESRRRGRRRTGSVWRWCRRRRLPRRRGLGAEHGPWHDTAPRLGRRCWRVRA